MDNDDTSKTSAFDECSSPYPDMSEPPSGKEKQAPNEKSAPPSDENVLQYAISNLKDLFRPATKEERRDKLLKKYENSGRNR